MKLIGESIALEKLQAVKNEFTGKIITNFEHRAKSCLTCETKGACCLDAHFVNVRITRLEAAAIRQKLSQLSEERQREVNKRIDQTIAKYSLSAGDAFTGTYACPLFEKGIGCLVHDYGKPLPCIAHACYERKEDLPPDNLMDDAEAKVEKLGRLTYGVKQQMLPLPLAIRHFSIRSV